MKLNQAAVGKPCSKCRRDITQEVVDHAVKRKADNARRSATKSREAGNHFSDTPPFDFDRAVELRSAKINRPSYRKMALELNTTASSIMRWFKKRGVKL